MRPASKQQKDSRRDREKEDEQYKSLKSKLFSRLEEGSRDRNSYSNVAIGSTDPHLGDGSGVMDSAPVIRSKEETKIGRERKRKDGELISDEGCSGTSTALALPIADGGTSCPTSGNESYKARKEATLVRGTHG